VPRATAMRDVVVDASVAIKWYTPEVRHANAKALLEVADRIFAPELIVSEVTNVAWAKARRGEISGQVALLIAAWIGTGVPALVPAIELNEHALRIALSVQHPVHDCMYLACAARESAPLVTDDRRLLTAVGRGTWRDQVIALESLSP
jgi:predicted nucleic acid-binding protein